MSQRIIKQPNGKFAVFSKVVDNFIIYNARAQEIQDYFAEEALWQVKIQTSRSIEDAVKHHPLRYIDCLETIKSIHGEEEAEAMKKAIGGS